MFYILYTKFHVYVQEFTEVLTIEQCQVLICQLFSNRRGIELAWSLMQPGQPYDVPPDSNQQLPWCIYGKCREMEQPIEKVCCSKQPCISTTDFLTSVVLDTNVLSVAIVNRSDVFADNPDGSPAS